MVKSVDGTNITTYCVHECEAANRIGMRSRRFIFTGHTNGAIQVSIPQLFPIALLIVVAPATQIWDLTTALELSRKNAGLFLYRSGFLAVYSDYFYITGLVL